MYSYVKDVSSLCHNIIKNYCSNFEVAIDATLGNGYDTDFLSSYFKKVYAFDVQEIAINNYYSKKAENVNLILDSHEYFNKYICEKVDCIVYNLGFLPGGDKSIATQSKSTLESLNVAITKLNNKGIITLAVYSGHEQGKEEKKEIYDFVTKLPKDTYGVLSHQFINRSNNPPELIVIEKK